MKAFAARMIGGFALVGGALALAGPAAAAPAEVGYTTGSLAVADLAEGRLDRAEHILAAQSAEDAQDPARLINLGIVYARSGRLDQARASFMAAGAAPAVPLVLSDGSEVSSRIVARGQLARLGLGSVASAE